VFLFFIHTLNIFYNVNLTTLLIIMSYGVYDNINICKYIVVCINYLSSHAHCIAVLCLFRSALGDWQIVHPSVILSLYYKILLHTTNCCFFFIYYTPCSSSCCCLNVVASFPTLCFVQEILRLAHKTSLYYPVYPAYIDEHVLLFLANSTLSSCCMF